MFAAGANGVHLAIGKIKKALFVILSLLVALSFIFSIGAFGNNNVNSQSSTTTTIPQTVTTFGSTNVIVTGYSETATIYADAKNSTAKFAVNGTLMALEVNGTISSYFPGASGSYQLLFTNTTKFSPYDLQQIMYAKLGANTPVLVNATASVLLPPILTLYYGAQKVSVRPEQLNYSMALSPPLHSGVTITVAVQALVTQNGSVYNNEIALQFKHT